MKKILLAIILFAAVLFLTANTFGAWALSATLTRMVGAPVKVGGLHFGIFSSRLSLEELRVRNPKGFREETLAYIHRLSVNYDGPEFFRGKVHLRQIIMDFGDVTIEKNGGNQINLLELGAVKGFARGLGRGGEKTQKENESAKEAKTAKQPEFQIDEVLVNIGKTRYVDSASQPPLVKEYDLGVHNEVFNNVTKPASLVKDIVFLILRKVGMSSLTGNFDILLKGLSGEFQSTVDDLKGKWLKS